MGILEGLGLHEGERTYDHPYFGQLFLAGVFKIIGYPHSLHLSSDIHSIETLYFVPRVLMGLLAVFDTFLVFMISDRRYNRNVAIIASIVFAVTPMSWFTRWILLDSLLLPFLLSSILFAIYSKDRTNGMKNINKNINYNRNVPLVLLSGIFLGLAIYTKIPAITAIPLAAFLIFTNNNKSWKILGLWFVPVIIIPSLWPIDATLAGDFNNWLQGVRDQSNRHLPLLNSINSFFQIDPVLLILGVSGLAFSAIRRDYFPLLWAIPVFIFFQMIGYVSTFHLLLLLPPFCIAGGSMISNFVNRIKLKRHEVTVQLATISILAIFGLVSTIMLISINVTSPQFETLAFVSTYLKNHVHKSENIALVASPIYSWIFEYVYKNDNLILLYDEPRYDSSKTDKILLIADAHFQYTISKKSHERLKTLYNNSSMIASFGESGDKIDSNKYPYTSLNEIKQWQNKIEVRINDENKPTITTSCVKFDLSLISVSCKSANLTYVSNELNNTNILHKVSPKTWILNANLEIKNGSTFYINSTDTQWLKINSTSGHAYNIQAKGNLLIDSTKVTSWDTETNNYARTGVNGTIPRSYIITKGGNGMTNITNSEIAYLGYNHRDSDGVTYYTGAGSTIRNNKIHDLSDGFNAYGTYNITIDNNTFYNNSNHGIDVHGNDLAIKNNTIYDNEKKGVFCSTGCHDILIESNKVYNNKEEGIMLYKNISNSIIKNNVLANNRDQVAIYDASNNNKIYNNNMTGGEVGIRVTSNSTHNFIHNNSIMNSNYGIYVLKGASDNVIDSNKLANSVDSAILVKDPQTDNNVFKNNILVNSQKHDINQLDPGTSQTSFFNNTIESTR